MFLYALIRMCICMCADASEGPRYEGRDEAKYGRKRERREGREPATDGRSDSVRERGREQGSDGGGTE